MKKITALLASFALAITMGSAIAGDASAATRKPAPKPGKSAKKSPKKPSAKKPAAKKPAAKKPAATKFRNCGLLNKKFPHGVAMPKAKDQASGRAKPVTNFTVNAEWYQANKHLDRDKDNIACEKK